MYISLPLKYVFPKLKCDFERFHEIETEILQLEHTKNNLHNFEYY